MSIWGLVAGALTVAGALLLLVAGVEHAGKRAWLRAVLAAQQILPVRLRPAVVALLGPFELLLSVALLAFLTLASGRTPAPGSAMSLALQAAALAQGVLYLVFAGHTALVMHRSPQAPCGCGGGDEPASATVVVRALVLGLGSLGMLLCTPPSDLGWLAVTAMAGAPLGAVGWLLPRLARH